MTVTLQDGTVIAVPREVEAQGAEAVTAYVAAAAAAQAAPEEE